MSKMKLEIGALEVQSFDAGMVPELHEGTVNGHGKPTVENCGSEIDNCPSSLGCTSIQGCQPSDYCETSLRGCFTSLYTCDIGC